MEKGAGIEVHGALKTQSTTLHVADGVWFTIDPDTNTTSGWSEGSVDSTDSTDAWSQGTVALEATQQLQFSGTLQQADGRANAKPVAVSLTGQSLELKKESDNGGKLSVWGNAEDSIRLTAKDAITVDGASVYASGDLALDGSAVTAKNGAQLTADGLVITHQDGTKTSDTTNPNSGDTVRSTAPVYIINANGVVLGKGALHYWAKTPFTFNVYQELTDLPDGVYAAEVTTQGKGDAKSFDLYVIGDNGEKKTAAIQDSGWKNWRTVRIDGITIKGGKATVGIEQQGNGDNWGSIDNVKFYRKL